TRTTSGCCRSPPCSARRSRAPPRSSRSRACSTKPSLVPSVAALIFEGDLELGSVGLDLAVGDDQVLLDDLAHTQLPQMLAGKLDRVLGGFFPGFRAGADHFDNFVDALWHGDFTPSTRGARDTDGFGPTDARRSLKLHPNEDP